jgi:flagellar assembly protein FliH
MNNINNSVTQNTKIFKSLNISVSPQNYIIGSNLPADKIFVKKKFNNSDNFSGNNNDTLEIDEVKQKQEILKELDEEINKRNIILKNIEQDKLNEIENKKNKILNDTEQIRNQLIENSKEQIEIEKKDGYQQGFDKGYLEALEQYNQKLGTKLQTLDNLIKSIEKEKNKKLLNLKNEVLEIVKTFAGYVINKEIENYPDEVLVNNLTEILEEIGDVSNMTIKVNPNNVENIRNLKQLIIENVSSIEKLKVIGIASIDESGCIIETESGSFDATLKTKFKNTFEQLKFLSDNF